MNLSKLNLSALDVLRPILPFPMWQKAGALAGALVLVLGLYFTFGWIPLQDEIDSQQATVDNEAALLLKNRKMASNLDKKQAEYAKLEKQLAVALNMLPKQSQIPELLENVSWAGKDSGLEFTLFKPGSESQQQIYAEVPVSFSVTGSYRQLLTFLKRVGELPRIVSIRDLTLIQNKAGEALTVSGMAVTYRFIEEKGKGGKGNN